MKKLAILLLAAMAVSSLAAGGSYDWFDLSVGINASFKDGALNSLVQMQDFRMDDWNFGMELRTKLLFLEMDMAGELGVIDGNKLSFSGLLLAGISEDLFNAARLGLCIGPVIDYVHDGQQGTLIIDGTPVKEISLKQALSKSRFQLRCALDFFLGPVIKLEVAYTIPTDFTIESRNLNLLVPDREKISEGKFSITMQMTLF